MKKYEIDRMKMQLFADLVNWYKSTMGFTWRTMAEGTGLSHQIFWLYGKGQHMPKEETLNLISNRANEIRWLRDFYFDTCALFYGSPAETSMGKYLVDKFKRLVNS